MVSYGYTLDHIAPERFHARDRARANRVKPYSLAICAAVVLGTSTALWFVLFEAVKRVVF